MDGAVSGLRYNIIQNDSQVLELARWKLVVAGTALVIGIGWSQLPLPGEAIEPIPGFDAKAGYIILHSIGALCLYLDLFIYRRLIAIHIIAQYIRSYDGENAAMTAERDYELKINELRKSNNFPLSERKSHLFSSLIISLGAVVIARIIYDASWGWMIIPLISAAVDIWLCIVSERARAQAQAI